MTRVRIAILFFGAASLLAPMSQEDSLAQCVGARPEASAPALHASKPAAEPRREALMPPALGAGDVWITRVPHGLTVSFASEPEPDQVHDPKWVRIWPLKGVKKRDSK